MPENRPKIVMTLRLPTAQTISTAYPSTSFKGQSANRDLLVSNLGSEKLNAIRKTQIHSLKLSNSTQPSMTLPYPDTIRFHFSTEKSLSKPILAIALSRWMSHQSQGLHSRSLRRRSIPAGPMRTIDGISPLSS